MQTLTISSGPSLIQAHWQKRELLHYNSIVYCNGKVLLFEECDLINAPKEILLLPSKVTAIDLVLKDSNLDYWIEITPHVMSSRGKSDEKIIFGEGSMGNEGFIAKVHSKTHALIWSLFSNFSNPFVRAETKKDRVIAYSEYGHRWSLPLNDPDEIVITV